ncbi:branched-chain amino acid ABC transporter permease [Microbaculum sp. FT89]|uniref:branched-chain amino acid ABC transporter permease n=1 Tax=Microbaculum sp. FT89 TaxID=3447298 RepID=UPI003F536E67
MDQYVEVFIGGIAQSAVYCIMAFGLAMVYGTARILNFAHGSLYTTGAYLAWVLTVGVFGLPLLVAAPILIILLFIAGVGLERVLIRPFRGGADWKINTMMVTLGLAFLLDNANLLIFGPVPRPLPTFVEGTVTIFGAVISSYRVAVFGIAIAILVGLEVFLHTHRFGQAVRAVAQDMQGAKQVGIDVNQVFGFTFGLSVVLTGVAGMLLGPIFLVSPQGGWELFLKAFVIVVLGGLGSTRGAVVAAFILGLIEAFVVYEIGASWTMPVWLLTLLIVLMIRPQGLMGVWAK